MLVSGYVESHHYNNLNQLVRKFGIEFCHDLVMPSGREDFQSCMGQAFGTDPEIVTTAEPDSKPRNHPLAEIPESYWS